MNPAVALALPVTLFALGLGLSATELALVALPFVRWRKRQRLRA